MGFLSVLNGSPSKSSESSQSGFSLLPNEIQDAFKQYGTALSNQIPNATAAYTPLAQTADETKALDMYRQGFAPTQQSLSQDIGMFMNPFQQYVMDPVNRAAQSDYSILKQDTSAAGQFGSNRQRLGANDIEQTRLSTIGGLNKQGYDSAVQNVLNSLIPQRQQDAQGLLGIGQFQRDLDTQTKTAPITGLQQIGQALGVLPTSGGSTSSGTSTGASKGLIDWFS